MTRSETDANEALSTMSTTAAKRARRTAPAPKRAAPSSLLALLLRRIV